MRQTGQTEKLGASIATNLLVRVETASPERNAPPAPTEQRAILLGDAVLVGRVQIVVEGVSVHETATLLAWRAGRLVAERVEPGYYRLPSGTRAAPVIVPQVSMPARRGLD